MLGIVSLAELSVADHCHGSFRAKARSSSGRSHHSRRKFTMSNSARHSIVLLPVPPCHEPSNHA